MFCIFGQNVMQSITSKTRTINLFLKHMEWNLKKLAVNPKNSGAYKILICVIAKLMENLLNIKYHFGRNKVNNKILVLLDQTFHCRQK